MVTEANKTCSQCGEPIETDDKRKIYCSNGCKQNAFRKRHGISTPAFLQPRVSNQKAVAKPQPAQKKISNPEYLKATEDIKLISLRLYHLETRRLRLAEEQAKLLNQDDALLTGLSAGILSVGAALGIAFLGMMLANATKDKEEKKRIMLIAGIVAISAAVLSAVVSHAEIKDKKQQRKVKKLEKLKAESDILDIEHTNTTAELAAHKAQIDFIPETILLDEEGSIIPREQTELSQRIISLEELKSKKFKSIVLGKEYQELIGEPELNFSMAVHGSPGNGKSTFVANLANDLAMHGNSILYIAAEEGFSKSMQKKLSNFQSSNFFVSNCRNITSVKDSLKRGRYSVIVLDSIQQIGIKPEQLSNLRASYPETAFVYILQSTKSGSFKGDNRYAHDADVIVKLDMYSPLVEKTRYK